MRIAPLIFLVLLPCVLKAQQKKPLDHSVYDGWQNIGERILSPDGHWIAYTVDVQEGDDTLYVLGRDITLNVSIARGYQAAFSADSRYLICKIKPLYTDIRQARIKKKKPEEGPKDSLGILNLGQSTVQRIPRVKSYRLPELAGDWVAYQLEAPLEGKGKDTAARMKFLSPDALTDAVAPADADGDESAADKKPEGSDLILRDLSTRLEYHWHGVGEYQLGKKGNLLAFGLIGTRKDSSYGGYFCVWSGGDKTDTILKGGKDYPKIAVDDEGQEAAFLAERDSAKTGVQSRTYQLWYFKRGTDSARLLLTKTTPGMKVGWSVSENGNLSFSRSGLRVLLGTAPIPPPKDTSISETEVARLDVWNYKDDYLQPMQLKNRDRELKRTYLGVYDLGRGVFMQLGDIKLPTILPPDEGDGDMYLGLTDYGKRVSMQWEGKTRKDVYAVDPATGTATLVQKDLDGNAEISPGGRYLMWYDFKARQYFTYSAPNGIRKISGGVRTRLFDEENDVPDDPDEYGVAGWTKGDSSVWIYDRYDIWGLDPNGIQLPVGLTGGQGRRSRNVYRYLALDKERIEGIDPRGPFWIHVFNDSTKQSGFGVLATWVAVPPGAKTPSRMRGAPDIHLMGQFAVGRLVKAKYAGVFLFTRETYDQSANLWVGTSPDSAARITAINPQQETYNWVTAHLVHWTTFKGRKADGILYIPEDFDPSKKYPMITYFYERLSDGLYNYHGPAPTPSALNIPFFVSRGYLVFTPDIRYTVGHPGKSAYDFIVSGVEYLCHRSYVDKGRLGLQGQSWGGYQVAYLVTATHLFKAAWAGAPVVNMFSAYGGIRWESGMNRQFQYEHTQSRIGATPWDKPELYIENSPLFHLTNVTTPLVIMANDNDGAVPWYQGIEMFTDMRRLGKPVWMLTYNGEAHNLMERRNRKDIQIREQQFFDWQLKDARPARWLTEGVPATAKGRDWGLELDGAP